MSDLVWEITDDETEMYATVGDSPPTTRYIDIEFEHAVSAVVTPLVRYEHYEAAVWNVVSEEWVDVTEFVVIEVEQIKAQTARLKVILYDESPLTPGYYMGNVPVQVRYIYIYGTIVGKGFTKTITEIDQTSIDEYGRRTLDLTSTLALAEATTRDMLKAIVANLKNPTPLVEMTVIGDTDAKLTQILTRTMSDRVGIVTTRLGLNAEFHIEKVRHEIQEGGIHFVTYSLGKVPGTEMAILDEGADLSGTYVLTY